LIYNNLQGCPEKVRKTGSRGSQTAVKKEVVGSVVMPVESVFSVAERLLAVKTRDESRLNQGEEPIIWQRTKNC
jgi:hypothetical protein